MERKTFIKACLDFSRKERIGVLSLAVLIVAVFLLPWTGFGSGNNSPSLPDSSWVAAVQAIIREDSSAERRQYGSFPKYTRPSLSQYKEETKREGTLFCFDPNTLDAAGWARLGLPEKTIVTIQKYLSKGGHFHQPEDLKKVYGLRAGDYERLAPWIRLERKQDDALPGKIANTGAVVKKQARSPIDINTADTSAWIALPGIGSKLASRIVAFREKLGGFYSVEQVKETWGLADSVFQKLLPFLELKNTTLRKIAINTATEEELKAHPYIRWQLAKPIISYRREHGPFRDLGELRKIMAITEEIYVRLLPYLVIGD